MKVLVVKTSSLGDVVHTLPALTDASSALPDLRFDWLVEEAFAEIPAWHPAVANVIPIAIRRWRKDLVQSWSRGELTACRQRLAAADYDLVIDAQGLLKSAIPARWARAPIAGFDRQTVREPLAAFAYRFRYRVARDQHAVERTRSLFAQALGYTKPDAVGSYALDHARFGGVAANRPRVLFLHGTTRAAKHWPEPYWRSLCERAAAAGLEVVLPWGNAPERERAERIAEGVAGAAVLPRLALAEVAAQLLAADAVVAVDTGLAHLAAALDRPTVALYGPTSPRLVGTYGGNQIHLTAADSTGDGDASGIEPAEMATLTPALVWDALCGLLDQHPLDSRPRRITD